MEKNKVRILIPLDAQNKEHTVIRFQRDGADFFVIRGEEMEVPLWVKQCAIQAGYIGK